MKLISLGIGNYMSIGNEPIFINLEKKVNVLVGANNSGKSNVLKGINWLSQTKNPRSNLDEIAKHKRTDANGVYVSLKVRLDDKPLFDKNNLEVMLNYYVDPKKILSLSYPLEGLNNAQQSNILELLEIKDSRLIQKHLFEKPENNAAIAGKSLAPLLKQLPPTVILPQFRQIIPGDNYKIHGDGIVRLLALWKSPNIGQETSRNKFDSIQNLLRRLLNMPNCEIDVEYTQTSIIIDNDGLRLPLDSYGAGTHELIIMAVAILSYNKCLFCMEEPEIHIHPKLQKEFLRFLIQETDNQYLISTHSNSLIAPSGDIEVIHLTKKNGVTTGRRVESTAHSLEVLDDLGIQPSDVLQANAVIWVEGPSDRIYINKWLHLLDKDLREGTDYSIMFYGGRLLSNLSLERDGFPNPDDLIPLLKINQNSIVVIDSDKKNAKDAISETKIRVCKECEQSKVYCWITDGREIENYLPSRILENAYNKITGKSDVKINLGTYQHLEEALKKAYKDDWVSQWSYQDSKRDMSRKIAEDITENSIQEDLKIHLKEIISRIRRITNGSI